ncbi:hypothetical protein D3C71_993220 [compost metagenome]
MGCNCAQARRLQIGLDAGSPKRQTDAANVLARLHPVHRTVQLGVTRHAFQITRLAANAGWVVVHVQIQPGGAEDRHQLAQEPIQQVQSGQLRAGFDQSVVVGGEDVQTVAHPGAAGKAHQEGDQGVEGLLALAFFGGSDTRFAAQNRLGEVLHAGLEFLAQGFCFDVLLQNLQATQQFVGNAQLIFQIALLAPSLFCCFRCCLMDFVLMIAQR